MSKKIEIGNLSWKNFKNHRRVQGFAIFLVACALKATPGADVFVSELVPFTDSVALLLGGAGAGWLFYGIIQADRTIGT